MSENKKDDKLTNISNQSNSASLLALPSWIETSFDEDGKVSGHKFQANLLAQQVLEDYDFQSISYANGNLSTYIYYENYWQKITKDFLKKIVGAYFGSSEDPQYKYLTNQAITNTVGILEALIPTIPYDDLKIDNLNIIPGKTQDYNLELETLKDKDPKNFFQYKRNYDFYDLNRKKYTDLAPKTNSWLLKSLGNDKTALKLLRIFIGSIFYRSYKPLQFIVFLKGDGADGKSVFLDYLSSILIGENITSHLSFDDLVRTGTNFGLSELFGKELNSYDDLNASYINSSMMGTIKQLTGGNKFDANVKNEGNIRFANHAKLFFACNEMPTIQNLSYAEKRRIYIFKWHRIANFETNFKSALKTERAEFASLCMHDFGVVKQQRDMGKSQDEVLPVSKKMEENWRQFQIDSDPIAQFIAQRCEANPNPTKSKKSWCVKRSELYEAFKEWADKHGLQTRGISNRKFNKRVENLGYEPRFKKIQVNGKTTSARVFINIMLLPDGIENDIDTKSGLTELDY